MVADFTATTAQATDSVLEELEKYMHAPTLDIGANSNFVLGKLCELPKTQKGSFQDVINTSGICVLRETLFFCWKHFSAGNILQAKRNRMLLENLSKFVYLDKKFAVCEL
ncbi:hypothetical protein PR048_021817 [Dryococelus australis]|uniref:Uncharacterized protein n=1 Tax=Dryococelus australis TaxID=614101 RepID=A0ABQ9GZ95_9NEOP|nr:hypothetical protein PR048_021817 [Dryococelus australis]